MESLLDSWFKFGIGEGAFYALFGFVFVFAGILLLILFFTALGFVMKKIDGRKSKKKQKEEQETPKMPVPSAEEEIPPEVVAAITAAIAVCTEGERQKCDFVVRRIKRI